MGVGFVLSSVGFTVNQEVSTAQNDQSELYTDGEDKNCSNWPRQRPLRVVVCYSSMLRSGRRLFRG